MKKTKKTIIFPIILGFLTFTSLIYADDSSTESLSWSVNSTTESTVDASTWTTDSTDTSNSTTTWITDTTTDSFSWTTDVSSWRKIMKDARLEIKEDKKLMKDEIQKNRTEIQNNWGNFHSDNGFMKDYLRKDLSKEEKQALLNLLREYNNSMQTILKEWKDALKNNVFDIDSFNQKISDLYLKYTEDLLIYVDSAKIDSFKTFMEARKNTVIIDKGLRINNVEARNEFKEKKSVLSQKLKDDLNRIIENRTSEKLTKIVNRIDKVLVNNKNERKKAMLEELKEIIQAKIDSL